ncbi:MAG: glycosyltransferase [Rhodoferax sp.]|nr:glycosyltransferase [Rhodoferax sp.]
MGASVPSAGPPQAGTAPPGGSEPRAAGSVGAIDLILVNYHCHPETLAALARLGPWTRGRVWVVDNSVDADEAQALRTATREMPWVSLLVSPDNLGFGRACNLAFGLSLAPQVLLLNPDARITPADIDRLAQALDAGPRRGAVAPWMFWDEDRGFAVPHTVRQTPAAMVMAALCSRWRRLARWRAQRALRQAWAAAGQTRNPDAPPLAVDFLTGAVLLVRRAAVQAAGGLFDARYFMFFEDSDLSVRLRAAGYGLAVVPQAQAVHTYRHKPFKAGLMGQARQQYMAARFGRFFGWTDGLRRLDRLARPVPLERWFEGPTAALDSAEAFAQASGDAVVLAWSPSPLMWPCLFRMQPGQATGFSAAEWALLEPGAYVALLRRGGQGPAFWWRFEVAAG